MALAAGFRLAGVDVDECPIADGGEGTADALFAALGGEWREAVVADPLGRPIRARWLLLPDRVAVVESAEAIGLDVSRSAIRCVPRAVGSESSFVRHGPRAGRARRRPRRISDHRRRRGNARSAVVAAGRDRGAV